MASTTVTACFRRALLKTAPCYATISDGLLDDYLAFGPLGQMNFSKRTFFVLCQPEEGAAFYAPIDLLILPSTAAAPTAPLAIEKDTLTAKLLVRNNSFAPLKGNAFLRAFGVESPFDVDLAPRSEEGFEVGCSSATSSVCKGSKQSFNLLSVGDNAAQLLLPNSDTLDMTLKATALPESGKVEMVQITLPEAAIVPDNKKSWLRATGDYSGLYSPGEPNPSAAEVEGAAPGQVLVEYVDAKELVEVPQLPGVGFKVGGQYALVSNRDDKNTTVISMGS